MTNEEAKQWIEILIRTMRKETSGSYPDPLYKDEIYIALDMAIKALGQEPCEDYVSRQSIKRKLQEHHDFFIHAYGGFSNMSQSDKSRVDEINNCIAMVVNEPPITPKEKTGHWIRWYETIEQEHCTIHDPHCKCSECNQEYDPYIASLFNYCPNCGRRIVEPQESEDKEVQDGNINS